MANHHRNACGQGTIRHRGKGGECVDCRKIYNRRWIAKNRKHVQRKSNERRWRRLGLKFTVAQYDALVKQQGGKCAICKRPDRRGAALALDHDHGTVRVRGLLCRHCNRGFGWLPWMEEHLFAIYEYRARYR